MRRLIIIFTVLACSLLLIPLAVADDNSIDLTVEVIEPTDHHRDNYGGDRGRHPRSEVYYEDEDEDEDEDKDDTTIIDPTTPEPVEPADIVPPTVTTPTKVFPWWWIVLGLLVAGLGFMTHKIRRRGRQQKG